MSNVLKTIFTGLIIAGIIMILMGVYYLIVKAGLPYQDPPMELQIEYAVNNRVGSVLSVTGLILTVVGAVLRIMTGVIFKRR